MNVLWVSSIALKECAFMRTLFKAAHQAGSRKLGIGLKILVQKSGLRLDLVPVRKQEATPLLASDHGITCHV